jgi:hypothetical protein
MKTLLSNLNVHLAVNQTQPTAPHTVKVFSVADLWNIEKRKRNKIGRRWGL